jgi:hypothetical protein
VGLAAALLPILIHLFTRSKARPIPFSSLRFLKQLQNQKIRRVKIRQILLLIVRTLAVLFLVLAFARPTCRTSSRMGSRSTTSAVIVLDNSVSMAIEDKGETLLDAAKKSAAAIVDQMQPGDELFLCTTDTTQPASRLAYHDFAIYRRALASTGLHYSATNLSAAMLFAQNLQSTRHNVNKEIYLLSDMQANGFLLDSLPRPEVQITRFAIPFQTDHPVNLAVVDVKLRSSILQHGKPVELEVTLANTGKAPGHSRLVQIYIQGQRVAQRTVSLEAGTRSQEQFHFIVDHSGWIEGYVQLEDDALMPDNLRYFSFFIPERLTIGLIGESSRGNELVQLALRSSSDSTGFIHLVTAPAGRSASIALDSLQLLILYDVDRLPDPVVEQMVAWHDRGGGLVLVLGRKVDLRWYNQRLFPAFHLPPVVESIGRGGNFSLGRLDASHPIFAGIFESNELNFARPQFTFALRVAPAADQHTLMAFSTGDPYLFEVRREAGSILQFTASFEPEESDMAYRTIFAPLLYRCLNYLASHSQNRGEEYLTGDQLRFRVTGQELQRRLEILGPENLLDVVHPQITASGAWINFTGTERPGLYRLQSDGKILTAWGVNIPAGELDLTMAERRRVGKSHQLIWVEDPGKIAQVIREARSGREYWRELMIAALILLLLEMALYREKGEMVPEE